MSLRERSFWQLLAHTHTLYHVWETHTQIMIVVYFHTQEDTHFPIHAWTRTHTHIIVWVLVCYMHVILLHSRVTCALVCPYSTCACVQCSLCISHLMRPVWCILGHWITCSLRGNLPLGGSFPPLHPFSPAPWIHAVDNVFQRYSGMLSYFFAEANVSDIYGCGRNTCLCKW